MNSNKNKQPIGYQIKRIPWRVSLLTGMVALLVFACQQNYTPKPHAYYRIDFPEKIYQSYESDCPFTFDYPIYGTVKPNDSPTAEPCWLNVQFPKYKGTIHLTYKPINQNFDDFLEDSWTIIYKKIAQKADAVEPYDYADPVHKVYGTIYDIKGNAASPVQFFVTDSVKNFLRGSLYFSAKPNQDSLAPVVSFFKEDIVHMMESVRWKEGVANKTNKK